MYVTPADDDGPVLVNATDALVTEPAVADAGVVTTTVTSAIAEIAVDALAESGCALAPWLVEVPIDDDPFTDPDAGAVKLMLPVSVVPGLSVVGMPANVKPPVAALYVAVAPPGSPLTLTPESPGDNASVYVTLAAADGPALLNITVPLTVVAAAADAGSDSVVVTSAIEVIVVVSDAESGRVFGPWLVAVPIDDDTVTAPIAGAM